VVRVLLTRGSVFVHLDPRVEGTIVPTHLRKQPQLFLQIGLDLPVPIPDLRIDDDGITGTLSFQRTPFECWVPWPAVFGVVAEDGDGMVWPEDLPTEIAMEVEREAQRARREKRTSAQPPAARQEQPKPRPAPALRPVQGGRSEEGGGKKRPLPPYLRVIK
jgi:stringent starvation protein B